LEGICSGHGKPLGIYLDKFSTYKINHKAELIMQIYDSIPESNERTIWHRTHHSSSPEAREELRDCFRHFRIDWSKRCDSANINTPKEGNRFLKEVFITQFNENFLFTSEKRRYP